MDDKPAASPAVRNPRKRNHRTNTTMIIEADVSTKKQKKAQVEEFVNSPSSVNQNNGLMFESNSSREKGEQSSHNTNYIGTSTSSGATFELRIADPSPDNDISGLVSSCSSHHDASTYLSDISGLDDQPLVETGGRLDQQETKLYHNINGSSTEPMEDSNHLPSNNQNTIAPGPNTNNYPTTEPENNDWMYYIDWAVITD